MKNVMTRAVASGVDGYTVSFDKFKTAQLTVAFYLPLSADTATGAALLPFMLTGCGAGYPDTRSLNRRLAELYGAGLSCSCDKLADIQVLKLSIECIENRYVPDGSDLFGQCAELLCGLIFDPLAADGRFDEQNFAREKRLALERIDGEINDKRRYARMRCEAEMCKGEPYGLAANGDRAQMEAMTAESLYGVWQQVLSTAKVRISVVSSEPTERIFDMLGKRFEAMGCDRCALDYERHPHAKEVRVIDERMPINQSKLVMGFSFDTVGGDRESYPMMVFGDLFGGGPYSRLFANVREKLSLCYYCSAAVNRRKGVMLVDSGVETDNIVRAHDAILEQLQVMKDGGFTDDELRASKLSLCESLRSIYDNGKALARWYADRVFDDAPLSPDEVRELVESVTREQIIAAARSVRPDTVYRLIPEEAQI